MLAGRRCGEHSGEGWEDRATLKGRKKRREKMTGNREPVRRDTCPACFTV